MNKTDLKETARNLVSDSKGILAMDESFPTIKKRFEKLNIEDTEKNRQIYRDLLVTAPDLNKYISGAILFDETIKQQTLSGQSFPDFLNSINIIPGIKVTQVQSLFLVIQERKLLRVWMDLIQE